MAAQSPGRVAKCCQVIFRPRVLLTFGIPLLLPALILTVIAFLEYPNFGIFHIGGILLLFVSFMCLFFGILMIVCAKQKTKMLDLDSFTSTIQHSVHQDQTHSNSGANHASKTMVKLPKHSRGSKSKHSKHTATLVSPRSKGKRRRKSKTKERKVSNVKLATVTEDREGERSRRGSACNISRVSLPNTIDERNKFYHQLTSQSARHVWADQEDPEGERSRMDSACNVSRASLPNAIDERDKFYHQQTPLSVRNDQPANVWADQVTVEWDDQDGIKSASSELSIVSDTAIYISQSIEMTPVEVIEQTPYKKPYKIINDSPRPRPVNLTNMIKSGPSPDLSIYSDRQSCDNINSIDDGGNELLNSKDNKTAPSTINLLYTV